MEAHSFGYWLRRKRKALDLTRVGLAKQVGCSTATIQKLEEEERRPSAQMVERLAVIFNIPPGDRSAFLRFARGEVRAGVSEDGEDPHWIPSAKRPRANLPVDLTSLIGREKEIAQVHEYLLRANVRLITLVGPPGIGKTRLGIEAARAALPDFADGVFFAALAPLHEPALLAATVAQSMGYVGARNVLPLEQLKEGIGDKRILIALDNCEHLVEEAASFVSSLLSACSRLKLLATSRESLRVPGEWLFPVPALEAPAFPSPGEDLRLDTETTSKFPALTLFAERARTVQPDFELTPENIRTVSAICRQLDGLPLAIELIAARTRLIPPQALLERLHEQLLLSADGMRAIPARQKSLKDAIDWSYRLLSEEEQRLFTYVSVYAGGFTLEAPETMFSPAFREKTISALILSLLDQSLLQRSLTDHEPRYTMLVTVQEFARQRLQETGQEAEIRDVHLAYFLQLAQQADHELRGPNQSEWLRRLHTTQDNLRKALEWAIETGRTETALQLARRLWWFWSMRSEFNEGRQWLERVLTLPDVSFFPDSYAAVLTQLAHHTCLQIGPGEAKPIIEQALTAVRAHGDPQILANALMVFGIVLTYEADFVSGRAALEESMRLFREAQDKWSYALAVMSLGWAAFRSNDQATAFRRNEQALKAFRELGDPYFQSVCLYEIGNLHAKQGDWANGFAELRESLTLSRELGSKYESAAALLHLAEAAERLGEPARAVRLYWGARNLYDSIGAWQPEDDAKWEEHLASCRAVLAESAFAEAMNEGRSMTMEQAIEYALEISTHS